MTTVERVHGVQLKPEVRIVGEDDEPGHDERRMTDPRISAASPC